VSTRGGFTFRPFVVTCGRTKKKRKKKRKKEEKWSEYNGPSVCARERERKSARARASE
jgi:hypothetical protein